MRALNSQPAITKLATAAGLAVLLLTGQAAAVEKLKVSGTGGALGMVEKIASESVAATGIELEIVRGVGSKGAIRAVADGALALAFSARALEPAEIARGLTAVLFARTALVFVTSKQDPNSLKSSELTRIFTTQRPTWADGSPLNLILRTRFDGDTVLLERDFAGMREAIEEARKRPDLPIAATDQDSFVLAQKLPNSFVQGGLSQFVTEKPDLRLVPIDGVEPSLANLESGKYPYPKPFYLVFSPKSKAPAQRLLEFLASEKGRAILRETGNLPAAE